MVGRRREADKLTKNRTTRFQKKIQKNVKKSRKYFVRGNFVRFVLRITPSAPTASTATMMLLRTPRNARLGTAPLARMISSSTSSSASKPGVADASYFPKTGPVTAVDEEPRCVCGGGAGRRSLFAC